MNTAATVRLRVANMLSRVSRQTWKGLASASGWQIANYLIPLLTFPYLARVLGVRGFGVLGIGTAIAGYSVLFTDWGFALSATQGVAQARNDRAEVNRIVWSTIAAKSVLGALSGTVITLGTLVIVSDPTLRAVLLISLINVLASIFSIDWALRGLEQFGKFAIASVAGRLAAVPLIFIMVQSPRDIPEAAFAWSAGALFTAAITITMALRDGILVKPDTSIRHVFDQIKVGTHIFLSTATISLYTNCLTLVLGATAGIREVGLFSAADRVRRPVYGLLSPIGMVFYPRIHFLASSDVQRARTVASHILRIQSAIAFALSAALSLGAPLAIHVLLGSGFNGAVLTLQILSWIILFIGISNVLGLMIMLPFDLKREFTVCTVLGAVLGLGGAIPLSYYFGSVGAAIAAVTAEFAVTASMFVFLRRRLDWFPTFWSLLGVA